jgi:hypothetical protein
VDVERRHTEIIVLVTRVPGFATVLKCTSVNCVRKMMTFLRIVLEEFKRNVCKGIVMNCHRLSAFSWKGFAACLKFNMKSQNERLESDGIICGRIHRACDQNSFISDVSEWLVIVIICPVAVKKFEINVAELLNARGLDFCLGYASGRNVSVIRLIL